MATDLDVEGLHVAAPRGCDRQPVAAVEWVDRHELTANGYNPNRVARPELKLLKVSIMADGWTQPIVARSDGEIVDGYHRWTVSEDPDVAALTGGMVPVVYLPDDVPEAHQRMSTVRHNRARGTHQVVEMSDLVVWLDEAGVSSDRIQELLSMEAEEVGRFITRGSMTERFDADQFGDGWKPGGE